MFVLSIFSIIISIFIQSSFNLTKKRVWEDVGHEMFVFIPEVCDGLGTDDANHDESEGQQSGKSFKSFVHQTGGYGKKKRRKMTSTSTDSAIIYDDCQVVTDSLDITQFGYMSR